MAECRATDINRKAAELLRRSVQLNRVRTAVEAVQTDLVASLEHRLDASVDLLLFNPPYVPTDDAEVSKPVADLRNADPIPREIANPLRNAFQLQLLVNGLSRAWAGGLDGRRVIDRFLASCLRLLSAGGMLYLLLLRENHHLDIVDRLSREGLHCEITLARKCRNEQLYIVRCVRR